MSKFLLLLCVGAFLISGCSNHLYGPVLFKADVAYQFKPMSSDSVKTANNISGSFYYGSGFEAKDAVFFTQLNFSHATTYKHFDVAYDGFGFLGHYDNNALDRNDPSYFSIKSASGFGLRGSADYFYTEGKTDHRVGIDAFYSKEFGDYAEFRRTAIGPGNIYTDQSTSLLTIGIAGENMTRWVSDPKIQDGYRFFLGSVIGKHEFKNAIGDSAFYNDAFFNKNLFFTAAYALKYHKGLFVAEFQDFFSFSFTFGYQL